MYTVYGIKRKKTTSYTPRVPIMGAPAPHHLSGDGQIASSPGWLFLDAGDRMKFAKVSGKKNVRIIGGWCFWKHFRMGGFCVIFVSNSGTSNSIASKPHLSGKKNPV